MIYVADSALEKIKELRSSENLSPDHFIRVSVTSGGCSGLSYNMEFDKGVKVITDLKSFLYLFDSTLEFSGGLDGKGFHFTNPNAARTCGCGESFSV